MGQSMTSKVQSQQDTLKFWIASDPTDFKASIWVASLSVKCNLVDLMRGGFFWSEDNIEVEKTYVIKEKDPEWKENPYSHHQILSLQDTRTTGWTAQVRISANSYGALAMCKFAELDHTSIYQTYGHNSENKLVYHFLRSKHESINCIFGDMPLEGFWAWPRADDDKGPRKSDEDENEETPTDHPHVQAGVADQGPPSSW